MISVFQVYFDERSKDGLEEGFIPHYNSQEDDYFENTVMKDVYEMNPDTKDTFKYIGVTSWKQYRKTRITSSELLEHITEKDIYIYSPPVQGLDIFTGTDELPHGIIRQPDIWDGHFHRNPQIEKDTRLLNSSGVLPFDIFDGKWQYCFYNYWIAKREVFDEYCKTVLLPTIKFYEQPVIKKQLPKWYTHPHTGRKHNSCLFILEGLFGAFIAHSNYSFEYIVKKKYIGKTQRIIIDGYERIPHLALEEKLKRVA